MKSKNYYINLTEQERSEIVHALVAKKNALIAQGRYTDLVGSSLVPFANKFPKNTKLYRLMTTKPGESN